MTPSLPLKDYRILITRGKGQASSLQALIEKYGGTPLLVPLLDFTLPDCLEEVKEQLGRLHTYDWLILTSKNGVDFLFEILGERPGRLPKLAVIGTKTEQALKGYGYEADFIPSEYVAERFVMEFAQMLEPCGRVLLAKGNLARTVIASGLKEKGVVCDEVIIYHTTLPDRSVSELVQMILHRDLDIITFTSSSTVNHFMQIVEQYELHTYINTLIIACIGPICAKTATKHGLTVTICPDVYTTEAMIEEVIRYIGQGN